MTIKKPETNLKRIVDQTRKELGYKVYPEYTVIGDFQKGLYERKGCQVIPDLTENKLLRHVASFGMGAFTHPNKFEPEFYSLVEVNPQSAESFRKSFRSMMRRYLKLKN